MSDGINEGDAQAVQRVALTMLHTQKQPVPHRHRTARLAWGGVSCIVIIAGVWTIGNLYGQRFSIQQTSYSARSSTTTLSRAIASKVQAYNLQIAQSDGAISSYPLSATGISVDASGSINQARTAQNSLSHRLMWWRPITLALVTKANTAQLQAFIDAHALVTISPAHDATLSIVDGKVKLTEGTAGKQYGVANATQTILDAASILQAEPLQMRSMVQQPTLTAYTLNSAKSKLEAIIKQPVHVSIDDVQVTPDDTTIGNWLIATPNAKTKTVDITVNKEAVDSYLDGVVGDHSHPSRSQVLLGGRLIVPGEQGVIIDNHDEASAAITGQLLAAKGVTTSLPTEHTSAKTVYAPTTGKWIEVDLNTKRMYVYSQNALQRTFLVSAGAPRTPTVVGTFAIFSKFTRQTMNGANADGSSYNQPNVPWVNYFYRDYAIHGNYWRPTSYFGNINSSHGCVGLTTSDAAWVYSWAPIGTPVVVHT